MGLIDWLFSVIFAIIGFGFNMIQFIFTVILALIGAGIASYKKRNGFIWGLVVFFFPLMIIVLPFIPKKMPKLKGGLSKDPAFRGKNQVIASIMALAAIVAKANGVVSKEDISSVRKFLSDYFNISSEDVNEYVDAFEYGKNHPQDYKLFTDLLAGYYKRRKDMRLAITYFLITIGKNEGEMDPKQDEQIRKIVIELGISEYEYEWIKNGFAERNNFHQDFGQGGYTYSYTYGSHDRRSYQQHYNQGMGQSGPSRASLVKKYSEVLGVSEDASMAEIKKAYRKLAKEYHPDKLASENMPEEYVELAKKKIIEINEAYEYLKQIKE